MAKPTKPTRNPSLNPRSRAARRATSPSINTDKSLTTQPRIEDTVLAPHRGAGILKKRKIKQPTRGQRVRHSKTLARAEAVADQLDEKLSGSRARLKKRQGRRAGWEDVNGVAKEEGRKAIRGPGRNGGDEGSDWEDEDRDEVVPFHGDTEIKVLDGVQVPAFASGQVMTFSMGPGVRLPPPSSRKLEKPVVEAVQKPVEATEVQAAQESVKADDAAESIPPVQPVDEIT